MSIDILSPERSGSFFGSDLYVGREANASGSSEPSSGSPEPARNGGCSQPSTAGGTASTNGSPDGVNAVYGSESSISSMTPTWRTSSLTIVRAHHSAAGAPKKTVKHLVEWVHYKGRERGWPRQRWLTGGHVTQARDESEQLYQIPCDHQEAGAFQRSNRRTHTTSTYTESVISSSVSSARSSTTVASSPGSTRANRYLGFLHFGYG